ncbi:hypothetical protein DVH05_017126 [Phytophthora capsici]|nr:hypothetical protein DVH05_017126 [Phytophthora capsici]
MRLLSLRGTRTSSLSQARSPTTWTALKAGSLSARSNRPEARPNVGTSRRDYGYDRLSPAEVVRRAASQLLDTYTCGPAPRTTDEVVQRQSLRERFLTPQVTTPSEYQERLRQQLHGEAVQSLRSAVDLSLRVNRP